MGWGEAHGRPPLHGRALLEALGPLLEPARSLRYENPGSFVDVTDDELKRAAGSLRALSYSCSEGARLLDRVREGRTGSGDPVPSAADEPCTILGQTCTLPECDRPCDEEAS